MARLAPDVVLDVALGQRRAPATARRTPSAAGRSARRRRRSTATSAHAVQPRARSSTSRGNTFSPPRRSSRRSRPSMNSRPCGDPSDRRRRLLISPSTIGLDVPARVALEQHLVVHVDGSPSGRAGPRCPVSSEEPDDRPARGGARRARRLAQVVGAGDRRPRDLGRPVQVVDHVAEDVHNARMARSPGIALAAGRDDAQARRDRTSRSPRRTARGSAGASPGRRSAPWGSARARSWPACPRGRSAGAGRSWTPAPCRA